MVTFLRTGDAQNIGPKVLNMGCRTYLHTTLLLDPQKNTFLLEDSLTRKPSCQIPARAGHLQLIWKFDYKPRGTVI